jgi:hypothetical protein
MLSRAALAVRLALARPGAARLGTDYTHRAVKLEERGETMGGTIN